VIFSSNSLINVIRSAEQFIPSTCMVNAILFLLEAKEAFLFVLTFFQKKKKHG
jgi:hypothetical protein